MEITFNAETRTLAEWSRQLGFTDGGSCLQYRIQKWGVDKALVSHPPVHKTGTLDGVTKPLSKWAKELGYAHSSHLAEQIEKYGEEVILRQFVKPRHRHGMSKWPEYRVWNAMLTRCTNPNHKQWADYGGRGISVCEEWKDFRNFIADMGRRPTKSLTLDRLNNDGDYEPKNCAWVSRTANSSNRRNNVFVTVGDRTFTISQAAERYGIDVGALAYRLKAGMSFQDAVAKPAKPYRHYKDRGARST